MRKDSFGLCFERMIHHQSGLEARNFNVNRAKISAQGLVKIPKVTLPLKLSRPYRLQLTLPQALSRLCHEVG